MKRIEDIFEKLVMSQVANAIDIVLSGKCEISSIIVPNSECGAISQSICNVGLKNREYALEGSKLILISKNDNIFDFIEEINNAPVSKNMTEFFFKSILNRDFNVK